MVAKLQVDITSEFDDKGIKDADRSMGGLKKSMSGIGKLGAAAAIGGVGAAAAGLVTAVKAGSDLEQSMGAVDSTFKGSAGEIKKFGKSAAKNLGVTQSQFNEMAAVSGSMLQSLGYDSGEAAKATEELAGRGADLAATFGGTSKDAMDAMNAALRGEYDSLEKYGVKLSAANIEQKAQEMGLADATGAVDDHAKAQAAMALIMEQSADKAGTFADESDTMAGQMQILGATFGDMAAKVGTALLPVITTLGTFIAETIVPAVETAVNWFVSFIESLTGAGDAAGGTTGFLQTLKDMWDQLAPSVMAAIDWFVQFAQTIWEDLQPTIQAMVAFFQEHVVPAFQKIMGVIMEDVVPAVQHLLESLEPVFKFIYGTLVPILYELAGPVFDALVLALSFVFTALGTLIDWIADAIDIVGEIVDVVSGTFTTVWDGIVTAVDAVSDAIAGVIDWFSDAIQKMNEFVDNIPGAGVLGDIAGAIGGLFDEPDGSGVDQVTIGLASGASSRMAGLVAPPPPAPGPTGGHWTRSGAGTIHVHGSITPQETARNIARILTGAKVRTGFVGLRP